MSQNNISQRSQAVRDALSGKERFADILNSIGVEVSRDYKFSLREERTPSINIYDTGTCFDFGEGRKRMDIIDVIAIKENLSMVESLKRAEELLMIDVDNGISSYKFKTPVFTRNSKDGTYDTEPLEESYIEYFRSNVYKHATKVNTHLEKLIPNATKAQKKKTLSDFQIGYDPKNDKLTIPVRSVKGEAMNLLKYSAHPGLTEDGKKLPKLKPLYGRRRVLFNLQVLKKAPKVLYIFEGEKDVLNATLHGIAAITQGAASGWKSWMAQSIVKACEYYKIDIPAIVIIQDHDRPGVLSTLRIFNDLKEIQPKTKMMFWNKATVNTLIKSEKIKPYKGNMLVLNTQLKEIPKGFDYTDYKALTT